MPRSIFARGRRFDSTAQSPAAELPLQRLRWTLLAFVFLVIAAGAGLLAWWFVKSNPGTSSGSFFSGIPDTFVRTVVVTALIVVPAVLLLYSYWRARLEWVGWSSGAIDVVQFAADISSNVDNDRKSTVELTALFQSYLSQSRIYTAAAVPGAGGSNDFIRVVESAGDAAKGPWRIASRFVRLLFPQAGYQVTGTLLPGDDAAPCALSVALTKLPKWSAPPQVIREATWERAVERAAHAVAAQILPRTRACGRAPWTHWRDRKLPVDLFDAYQRAQVSQANRRYDEAMRTLHQALELDPSNVWLRLDIGQLQEQLDLRLDALLTYDDVIRLLCAEDRGLASWWSGPGGDQVGSTRLRTGDPALLVARYRHAVLLGLGDKLSDQWWNRPEVCGDDPAHWTARERQRAHIRQCLRRRFAARHNGATDQVQTAEGTLAVDTLLDASQAAIGQDERERRMRALRVFLAELSQEEIERLEADYRMRWRWLLRGRGELNKILPHRSIRLCVVWAHLRRAMALKAAGQPACPAGHPAPGQAGPPRLPGMRTLFDSDSWPPNGDRLEAVVGQALDRAGRPQAWQEHYNAACVYAVALLSVATPTAELSAGPDRRQRISQAAAAELDKAVSCGDSGFLAAQRSWLLFEDPDLEQLRSTDSFRDFGTVTFAPRRPVPRSPASIHVWEMASYVAGLISAAAAAMEKVWHQRAGTVLKPVDAHTLENWWAEEAEAWRRARRIAVDHRDWQTRAGVLALVQRWSQRQDKVTVEIEYREFSEQVLIRQYTNLKGHSPVLNGSTEAASVQGWTDEVIKACDRRLAVLAWILYDGRGAIPRNVEKICFDCLTTPGVAQREHKAWADEIAIADATGEPIDQELLRRLCQRSGERWKLLAVWFDDWGTALGGAHRKEEAFANGIADPVDRTTVARRSPTLTRPRRG